MFLILGCDGVWETKTPKEMCKFVKDGLNKGVKMSTIVEDMLDWLVAPDTSTGLGCDNMTCIIVDLRDLKKK